MKTLILLVSALLISFGAHAELTPAQYTALKADILADSALAALAVAGNYDSIAQAYNVAPAQACTAWRTEVMKHEITTQSGPGGTAFNWSGTGGYISRSQGERDAFKEIFNSTGSINPSLPNVQAAFADIFSGTGAGAVANRTHFNAMSRRPTTRAEKLFATGECSDATPATLSFEGSLEWPDVRQALTEY